MKKTIRDRIAESIAVKQRLSEGQIENIERAARAVMRSLEKGGKVMVFGNGGSAADSQHIAAELVGRFKKERRPLAAIALTTDTSILTAVANDYGYDATFSRQLDALGRKGDVVIGISTSGNSRNVIEAVRRAGGSGMTTIGLIGCGGGMLKKECDVSIIVDSDDTARIQEAHITVGHILCELIEDEFSKKVT